MTSQTITALGTSIINLINRKTPIATASTVGMVKPDGSTISIDADGVISSSGGSGSGLQMFDTVIKDHVLSFEESGGLALQGTYVYKDAVAGSRYGYPDFYDECVAQKTASTLSVIPFVQPVLTSNGVMGADDFAVEVSSANAAGIGAYAMFNGTNTNDSDCWHSNQESNSWLTFFSKIPINVTNLQITNRNSASQYVWAIAGGSILASNDNSEWTTITEFTNTVTTANTDWNIDLSSNTNYYKYYRIQANNVNTYVSIGKINVIATEKSVLYKNSNGHVFYDIADKATIDEIYNNTGSAWFYGVDTANERIFLPRNNNFVQFTVDTSKVGESVEAGLPNIKDNGYLSINESSSTLGDNLYPYNGHVWSSSNAKDVHFVFDASKASPIYGKSDTVQPPAVKKILYMVVGNTEVTSSITNVTEITTSENDTIPLFTAQYFDFTPNNPSWLKAGTQQNSGGIYATAYNTLVNCLTDNIYNIKVVDTANMTSGVDYSEYWKVDQTNMTFITPTSISNKALTGAVVGNGMSIGLTNGSVNFSMLSYPSNAYLHPSNAYGQPVGSDSTGATTGINNNKSIGITTDPTKSGMIAEESTTSQLYFKVANAVQNLELLDVGEVLEDVANKISRQDCPAYIVETYQNGASWYRVWSDGWCEQGGQSTASTVVRTVNFVKPFVDANYYASATKYGNYRGTGAVVSMIATKSANSMEINNAGTDYPTCMWEAKGYIN